MISIRESLLDSIQDIYDLAHIYYTTKEYSRAEKLLNVPKVVENNLKCRLLLAQCALEMQKYNFIIELFTDIDSYRSKDEDSKSIHSAMYHVLGQAYSKLHKTVLAKEAFLLSLKLDMKCMQSLDWLIDNEALNSQEWERFLLTFESNEFLLVLIKMKLDQHVSIHKSILESKYGLENDSDVLLISAKELFLKAKYKECLKITEK